MKINMDEKRRKALYINQELHTVLRIFAYPAWREKVAKGISHDLIEYETDKLIIRKSFGDRVPSNRKRTDEQEKNQQPPIMIKLYDIEVALKMLSEDHSGDRTQVLHIADFNDEENTFDLKLLREGRWIRYISELAKQAVRYEQEKKRLAQLRQVEEERQLDEEERREKRRLLESKFSPVDDSHLFEV